ncbi:50S ribosomal protein L21 [Candidatus Roizmanbacteria bacterium RIFCSPHIGHO2_12_FULL_41_11]|uniref:50S ribosomal protein L21 n=1 Tax=Candidatus Roizmanbacteria bacterium RIFCSPHIGHO2_12_FULL_41_11 TaxID=1802052 RepID=A0A1F7I2K6_9BACT|nr:MAG: 50S ribosomal protein L21 [Candidatus Roizmanbacteria bacterium RIFCSPHIGHO2_12_FULL_41_11]
MAKYAVVKTGSRQFIVSEGKLITTDKIKSEKDKPTDLEVLLRFNDETGEVEIGTPHLPKKAKVEIVEQLKGDKIRVAKFKAKVRYRRVQGFRPQLSKIKIQSI